MSDQAVLEKPATLPVTLTQRAAMRVQVLAESQGDPSLGLRVTVSGGGCSGFQYGFNLDNQVQEDDVVLEQFGTRLVVDQTSLELLNGAAIDFVQELVGSSFRITNPNAASTCGCGNSFSL